MCLKFSFSHGLVALQPRGFFISGGRYAQWQQETAKAQQAIKMIRWLLLCIACSAVYWLSVLAGPGENQWFFVANGGWSLALVVIAVMIGTRTGVAIAALECAAIVLNLTCLWQYITGAGWLYGAYGEVIEAIVIAEIVVLAMGAPCDGVRRMVRERWGPVHHWGSAYLRRILAREACQ